MDYQAASLALLELLMNEGLCDSQRQSARGMLPYHPLMNVSEELFFRTVGS